MLLSRCNPLCFWRAWSLFINHQRDRQARSRVRGGAQSGRGRRGRDRGTNKYGDGRAVAGAVACRSARPQARCGVWSGGPWRDTARAGRSRVRVEVWWGRPRGGAAALQARDKLPVRTAGRGRARALGHDGAHKGELCARRRMPAIAGRRSAGPHDRGRGTRACGRRQHTGGPLCRALQVARASGNAVRGWQRRANGRLPPRRPPTLWPGRSGNELAQTLITWLHAATVAAVAAAYAALAATAAGVDVMGRSLVADREKAAAKTASYPPPAPVSASE